MFQAGFVGLDACLFVLSVRPAQQIRTAPSGYAQEYQTLHILGIIGVHVDGLLCAGFGKTVRGDKLNTCGRKHAGAAGRRN